jgi:hypothetical protein
MLVEIDFSHNTLRDDDVCQIMGVLACICTIAAVSFEDNRCGSCAEVVKSAAWTKWRQAGLTVPPDEVVSQGWMAVIKYLQKVRICIFIA